MTVTAADIDQAAGLLAGHVLRTPCVPAPELSELCGAEVHLKLENLQLSGSFKTRGALVCLMSLDADQRRLGVVAMSAGNHAQGVAYHARRMGIPATIVMPRNTPFTKVERTERLGAKVVLQGATLSEAEQVAHRLADSDNLAFIHPYDDAKVIAGQGTVGLEMLADCPDLDYVVVPVGGGGLIAGMAVAMKAQRPSMNIIGVQSEFYPSMVQALRGRPLRSSGNTIAEGIAVKAPGALTVPIVRQHVDEILLVGETVLERSVQVLMETQKIVAEGAGAAALAALLGHPQRFQGRKVGLVVSGGNIDARLLASILMRSLGHAGRLVRLRIEIDDAPGMLARATTVIGEGGGNIIEIYHQRLFSDVPVKYADVDVVVETTSARHVTAIIAALRRAGFPTRVLGSSAVSD